MSFFLSSTLTQNEHVHFHCCVIDGVFEPAESDGATEGDDAPGVVFHAADLGGHPLAGRC